MNKKRNLIIALAVVCIVAIVVTISLGGDNSSGVKITDEKMAKVISESAQRDKLIENTADLCEDDLKDIKRLNIGYVKAYTTLLDITKCSNLEELYMGVPHLYEYSYYESDTAVGSSEYYMNISQIESEIDDILKECNSIKKLYIRNAIDECELTSIEFLKNGESIQELWIEEQGTIDYSPILNCTELTVLSLDGCAVTELGEIGTLNKLTYLSLSDTDIAVAEDIIKLPNLETLCIMNTPLAENEEELERIYEALPEIKIYK